jgi:hypothetical protein
LPHTLVVLADLRRVVREEERAAWQRIVRVLSHEINNSLAPIQSIAASLQAVLGRGDPSEWVEDVRSGLTWWLAGARRSLDSSPPTRAWRSCRPLRWGRSTSLPWCSE